MVAINNSFREPQLSKPDTFQKSVKLDTAPAKTPPQKNMKFWLTDADTVVRTTKDGVKRVDHKASAKADLSEVGDNFDYEATGVVGIVAACACIVAVIASVCCFVLWPVALVVGIAAVAAVAGTALVESIVSLIKSGKDLFMAGLHGIAGLFQRKPDFAPDNN